MAMALVWPGHKALCCFHTRNTCPRARIQGTDVLPGNQAVMYAEAPLSEVMSYSNQLKSITAGSGSYSMEYSHDENTPPNVQADVIKAYSPKDEED